jgi:plasmid maintenance system antidote protein VapI
MIFSAAYQRILQVTGAASQNALAAALGVKQSSVWDAVHRGKTIPSSWLVGMVERYGVSPLWIKFGQGSQRLSRSLEDISLEEIMAELGRRQDVIFKNCIGSGVTPVAQGQ